MILTNLRNQEGWKAAVIWALIATLGLRVILGLTMGIAWRAASPYLPPDITDREEVYGKLDVPDSFPGDFLLGVWPRWDAVHHLNLALRGYFDLSEGDSVFYPLYAILTRIVSEFIGGNVILSGLIVSTLATILAFTCLFRLSDMFYGGETAGWTLAALAIYPTVFFLLAPFSESLFLALTIGAFIAAYRNHWWAAGILGFLASLTRGPGMLTVLPLAWIALRDWRETKPRLLSRWGVSVLAGLILPVAGSLLFIAWRDSVGFPSISETLRRYSGLVLADPVSGLVSGIQQWIRVKDLPTTLDILSAFLFIIILVVMLIRPKWRKPEWIIYLAANLILFLSKQSFVASSLQSLPRYVLMLFPVYIVIGSWLASAGRWARFLYLTISTASLIILSMLYALWIFIA